MLSGQYSKLSTQLWRAEFFSYMLCVSSYGVRIMGFPSQNWPRAHGRGEGVRLRGCIFDGIGREYGSCGRLSWILAAEAGVLSQPNFTFHGSCFVEKHG